MKRTNPNKKNLFRTHKNYLLINLRSKKISDIKLLQFKMTKLKRYKFVKISISIIRKVKIKNSSNI